MVKDLDGLVIEYCLGKEPGGHVRSACRPVNSEKAQASGGNAIELGVAMGHELIGLLGRSVKGHRLIDKISFSKRDLVIHAIDRTGAGIDQMLDLMMTTTLQDRHHPDEVAIHIGKGILQRITHTGLGCQMNDLIKALLDKKTRHPLPVCQIKLDKAKIGVGS